MVGLALICEQKSKDYPSGRLKEGEMYRNTNIGNSSPTLNSDGYMT